MPLPPKPAVALCIGLMILVAAAVLLIGGITRKDYGGEIDAFLVAFAPHPDGTITVREDIIMRIAGKRPIRSIDRVLSRPASGPLPRYRILTITHNGEEAEFPHGQCDNSYCVLLGAGERPLAAGQHKFTLQYEVSGYSGDIKGDMNIVRWNTTDKAKLPIESVRVLVQLSAEIKKAGGSVTGWIERPGVPPDVQAVQIESRDAGMLLRANRALAPGESFGFELALRRPQQ